MTQCSKCDKKPKKTCKRIPRGWKRLGNEVFCAQCWQDRFILRAITIPVVGPVDREWPEFRKVLRDAWGQATALSNWMMMELYKRDVRREPVTTKLQQMPRIYLYPDARAAFPELPANTVSSMEQTIQAKYRATRYKLLWTREVSLPNYRYPAPIQVHNRAWTAHYDKDNVPLVSLRLAGERWTLRLRGGHQYRRQLVAFAKIVSGTAVQGELALYRQRSNGSDHRNGVADRDRGGQHAQYRVMCKMVAWLPKQAAGALSGTLFVHTNSDSLLVALNVKDERLWIYHGDQILRWTAEHRRRLNRWSDDAKAGNRPPDFGSRREAAARKYHHRLDTVTHQIAAELIAYAKRRRFATIRYDDSDQRYCDRFPYFRLAELVTENADAAGIQFERSCTAENAGTSRNDTKEELV